MQNDMKWESIPLTVTLFLDEYSIPSSRLRQALFETPCSATQKYDGTNVGKDENGVLYGRNHTIDSSAKMYQKTSLAPLHRVDTASIAAVKADVAGIARIDPSLMDKFIVYGELMCNTKYDYEKINLAKKAWPVFGAMIRPADKADKGALVQALCNAGMVAMERDTGLIMVGINKVLAGVFEKRGFLCVAASGEFECMYDLIMANKEWMMQGRGEGLVIASNPLVGGVIGDGGEADGGGEASGGGETVIRGRFLHKWKIGMESQTTNNEPKLKTVLEQLLGGDSSSWCGDMTSKAQEMFQVMLDVNSSKLVCGEVPRPKEKEKQKGGGKMGKSDGVKMSPELVKIYEVAIESAASKFDHREVFFAKDKMKGAMSYAGLIAAECREDVEVDANDSEAMDKHQRIVTQMVKNMFIDYMRTQSKKKKAGLA